MTSFVQKILVASNRHKTCEKDVVGIVTFDLIGLLPTNYIIIKLQGHTEVYEEMFDVSNGNRTEWSLIRSVIIRVINKNGRPRSGIPICLITSMINIKIAKTTPNS